MTTPNYNVGNEKRMEEEIELVSWGKREGRVIEEHTKEIGNLSNNGRKPDLLNCL